MGERSPFKKKDKNQVCLNAQKDGDEVLIKRFLVTYYIFEPSHENGDLRGVV